MIRQMANLQIIARLLHEALKPEHADLRFHQLLWALKLHERNEYASAIIESGSELEGIIGRTIMQDKFHQESEVTLSKMP